MHVLVAEAFSYHVLLDLQVLIDEVCPVLQVCHDASHMCCGQHHRFRLFFIEKFLHGNRVQQVQFLVRPSYQIRISPLLQVVPDGRSHQSVVSCHKYFCRFIH